MLKDNRRLTYIPYGLIALLYIIFNTKYMPEYLDDAWTLSWAYGLTKFGDVTDYVFGYVNTRGSILFGRGYAYFYGTILNLIGWSRSNGIIISTVLLWTTAFIWFKIAIKLGYSKKVAHIVAKLFLLMEIYFSIGNKLRSDSLALCVISFAFYMFIQRHYLIAGFLSIIGFEVHVISLTLYFYILAYLISIFPDMKSRPKYYIKGALLFIGGVALGLVYYFLLQKEYLPYFFEKTTDAMSGHTLFSYYWKMKYAWRHLPEILIILVALVIVFKKGIYKKDKFLLPFFISTLISSFILRRGNYHYTAFIYPSVLFLIAITVDSIKKPKTFWALLLLYLIPQYGFLYYTNHSFNQKDYETKLINSVPTDKIIMGNSGSWFALKDRDFYEYGYYARGGGGNKIPPNELYFISTQRYRDNIEGYRTFNDKFFKDYSKTEIDSFKTFDDLDVKIFLYKKDVD